MLLNSAPPTLSVNLLGTFLDAKPRLVERGGGGFATHPCVIRNQFEENTNTDRSCVLLGLLHQCVISIVNLDCPYKFIFIFNGLDLLF